MPQYATQLWLLFVCYTVCCSFVLASRVRLHIFSEILTRERVSGDVLLPVEKLQNVVDAVFGRIRCYNDTDGLFKNARKDAGDNGLDGNSCTRAICVDIRQVIVQSGGDVQRGVTEEQFLNASVILLFHITNSSHICHTSVDAPSLTTDAALAHVTWLISGAGGLQVLLDVLKDALSQDNTTKATSSNMTASDRGPSHETTNPETLTGSLKKIPDDIKEKCISVDALYYYVGKDGNFTSDDARYLCSVVVYLLYMGSKFENTCSIVIPNTTSQPQNGSDFRSKHRAHGVMAMSSPSISRMKETQLDVNHRLQSGTKYYNQTFCATANLLFELYESDEVVYKKIFEGLCPGVINKTMHSSCIPYTPLLPPISDIEKFGYAILAITTISLCSTTAACILPFVPNSKYGNAMAVFLGLAAGTLSADAVLHLIPMAMGLHSASHHHKEKHVHVQTKEDEYGHKPHILPGMLIIGGIYLFFVMEIFMTRYKLHSHPPAIRNSVDLPEDLTHSCPDVALLQNGENGALSPLAMMMIFSDAVHNFADGLAVGAAFSGSLSTGIATSIAVFTHELPHELGDFAVLLKSGMSFRKAVMVNFAECLPAYVGVLIGMTITTIDIMQQCIFSVTAGMFLYIALVDLLPQQIAIIKKINLILSNSGLLAGIIAMFLLALIEDLIDV